MYIGEKMYNLEMNTYSYLDRNNINNYAGERINKQLEEMLYNKSIYDYVYYYDIKDLEYYKILQLVYLEGIKW